MKPQSQSDHKISKRHLISARLLAVQALYSYDIKQDPIQTIIESFLVSKIGSTTFIHDLVTREEIEIPITPADINFFKELTEGTVTHLNQIDEFIHNCLSGSWNKERLEEVLQAILRVACFELITFLDVPMKVVISEYMAITDAFYEGAEPGLVNAILNQLSQKIRSDEFLALKAK
jgi:N utilization substance protein B